MLEDELVVFIELLDSFFFSLELEGFFSELLDFLSLLLLCAILEDELLDSSFLLELETFFSKLLLDMSVELVEDDIADCF